MENQGIFGTYERKIDEQKRIVLPKKLFRPFMAQEKEAGNYHVYGCKYHNYIACYPDQIYGKRILSEGFRALPDDSPHKKAFLNPILLKINRFGKINPPSDFKESLEDRVTIVGMGDYFEIWKPEEFKKEIEHFRKNCLEICENLGI